MLFHGYLIIDWSAARVPVTGKDSIWYCHLRWTDDCLEIDAVNNPATRLQAYHDIRQLAKQYVEQGKRLLIGFDFAYGYPAGFARRLLPGKKPSWRALWQYLHAVIEDDANNLNNRFAVASAINRKITQQPSPFWGCPERQQSEYLGMRKPQPDTCPELAEFRIAEQGIGAQSVWRLSYPGAVGSQVLMGLPYVHRLRFDQELESVSCVWPFETGLRVLDEEALNRVQIVHAEIYPSLVRIQPKPGEIKDKLQVTELAQWFAAADHEGALPGLFAGRHELDSKQQQLVETEEGWILGA